MPRTIRHDVLLAFAGNDAQLLSLPKRLAGRVQRTVNSLFPSPSPLFRVAEEMERHWGKNSLLLCVLLAGLINYRTIPLMNKVNGNFMFAGDTTF